MAGSDPRCTPQRRRAAPARRGPQLLPAELDLLCLLTHRIPLRWQRAALVRAPPWRLTQAVARGPLLRAGGRHRGAVEGGAVAPRTTKESLFENVPDTEAANHGTTPPPAISGGSGGSAEAEPPRGPRPTYPCGVTITSATTAQVSSPSSSWPCGPDSELLPLEAEEMRLMRLREGASLLRRTPATATPLGAKKAGKRAAEAARRAIALEREVWVDGECRPGWAS